MVERYAKNGSLKRFELTIDDQVAAWVDYEIGRGVIALNHTEVAPSFRGRGLAGDVVTFALVSAENAGVRVVPNCSFVASFIKRHSEYEGLVA
ncbi:MAG: GNAT family N-acetyltransferase [Actinomycetota bacterium]